MSTAKEAKAKTGQATKALKALPDLTPARNPQAQAPFMRLYMSSFPLAISDAAELPTKTAPMVARKTDSLAAVFQLCAVAVFHEADDVVAGCKPHKMA